MLNQVTSEATGNPDVIPGPKVIGNTALGDILNGLAKWRIWTALSWQEFRSTYRRSILGILWVMMSFAGFIFVKIVIFSSLLATDNVNYYNAYLTIGFFLWFYLQQSIRAAPDTFFGAKGWIQSELLPLSLYAYKNATRELYNFFLTLFVVAIALLYVGYPLRSELWMAIPAFLFILLNAISTKILLGTISARFRDISHLVNAVILPMMFLTPIFWMPSQMGDLMTYLWWNPLFHYMEIFRAPILDGIFPVESWIFVGVTYALITSVGFILFARYRQRIVFWF